MKARKPPNQKPEKLEPSTVSQLGTKKLWLFRMITLILIPLLLLIFLECDLRLFGYGHSTSAVVKHKLGNKEVYCHNYQFGWRFFPRNIARDFDGFVFETTKPPKTFRIFVMGASAAMGMGAPAYNFGRILEVMLNEMYPETSFEVHTAATVAINSHAVLEIAKDCAKYEPDLFIVYLGNNEVVGPFGPGSVFAPLSPSLLFIRANIAVKTTRTGQLVEQILRSVIPRSKAPQRWGGLGMFHEKQVRRDNPALESVYKHFEKNLQDICRTARKSGAKLIVSNVGRNLKDSPPFASLHRADLTEAEKQSWEQIYQKGIDYETDEQYTQAIKTYLAAAEIDETFADLQFRLGKCHWESGHYEVAKQHFLQACQYDTLRFRADVQINEIIRHVAATRDQEEIYFVDSIAAFEENSPHQTPGKKLFYEHVHLNFKGNYILARAIFPHIQKILPPTSTQKTRTVITEEQAAKCLAYTNFERRYFLNQIYQKMFNEPPFTNQLHHNEFMVNTKRQIEELDALLQTSGLKDCLRQYETAIQKNPDDWHLSWQYAVFLGNALKDTKAQEVQLRNVIQRCPYYPAYLSLGKILHKQGKIKEAQDILYELLELKPNSGKAHVELALIYRQLRNNEKYIEHLSKSLSIYPTSSIEPYGALAEAYGFAGKPDKAIRTLYQATKIFPEKKTAPAHASLGYLLNTQGKYEKAMEELKIALKINPDYANDKLFKSLLMDLEAKVKR